MTWGAVKMRLEAKCSEEVGATPRRIYVPEEKALTASLGGFDAEFGSISGGAGSRRRLLRNAMGGWARRLHRRALTERGVELRIIERTRHRERGPEDRKSRVQRVATDPCRQLPPTCMKEKILENCSRRLSAAGTNGICLFFECED